MALTKEARQEVEDYILSCITSEDEELTTDKAKLEHALKRFKAEYGYMIERKGRYNAFADWLSGLALNFDYMNYEIIKLGNQWGLKLDDERTENYFLKMWWSFLANHFFKMCDKYGVKNEVRKM